MKIYTRTGDDGTTGLFGGGRVRKSDARIECVGSVDELNASLGVASALLAFETPGALPVPRDLLEKLRRVQDELFIIGSHLSVADNSKSDSLPTLDDSIVDRLEMEIDVAESHLAPLRSFILPGGTELAARLHLARTICRRAERLIVSFAMDRPVPQTIVTYLNRLSDWLFVHARQANHAAGIPDIPWKPAK